MSQPDPDAANDLDAVGPPPLHQGTSRAHDDAIECETTRNVEMPHSRSEA
jgi:hypothetical protein